jgi:hypothetical protein
VRSIRPAQTTYSLNAFLPIYRMSMTTSADKDSRRHRRFPYANPVRISWEEQGQPRYAMTKCINVSEKGLRIESAHPVKIGTLIMLRSERINLHCSATVKQSVRQGSKYLLGLQLTDAVRSDAIADVANSALNTLLIENFNNLDQKV